MTEHDPWRYAPQPPPPTPYQQPYRAVAGPAGGTRRGAAFPHAEPTPYHLMLRTWTYALVAADGRHPDRAGGVLHGARWCTRRCRSRPPSTSGPYARRLPQGRRPLRRVGPTALLGLNLGSPR